jgi:hypothetical protein
MRATHARLVSMGLNDSHFDAIIELLGGTLKELGVADNLNIASSGYRRVDAERRSKPIEQVTIHGESPLRGRGVRTRNW